MKDLNLSPTEFADKVGISRAHVYRLEKGEHPVNILTLRKIAIELNCSVAELIGE